MQHTIHASQNYIYHLITRKPFSKKIYLFSTFALTSGICISYLYTVSESVTLLPIINTSANQSEGVSVDRNVDDKPLKTSKNLLLPYFTRYERRATSSPRAHSRKLERSESPKRGRRPSRKNSSARPSPLYCHHYTCLESFSIQNVPYPQLKTQH